MKPTIFSACSRGHYERYADTLIKSAHSHGMGCIVYNEGNYSTNESTTGIFYKCLRFVMLPEILETGKAFLVVAGDSFINSPIEIDDHYDLGMFLTGIPAPHKAVKARCLYVRPHAMDFAKDIANRVRKSSSKADIPLALNAMWEKYRGKYRIMGFGPDFMGEATHSKIWTGQGGLSLLSRRLTKQNAP